jgi:peptidoglycan biosynthesis protein MviN/MurJ (putative lipid II flippase)
MLITHSCACPVFLGGGYERKLLKMTATEGALNLVISVILAASMGVVGVALGTMIPAVLIGWLWAIPLTLRFTGRGFREWMSLAYRPIVAPVVLSVAIAGLGCIAFEASSNAGRLIQMLVTGLLTMAPVAATLRTQLRKGLWAPAEEETAASCPLGPAAATY